MNNKIFVGLSDNNCFLLTGNVVPDLLSIRAVKIYLNNSLNATIINTTLVEIPYTRDFIEITLQKIITMLQTFDFSAEISSEVEKIMHDFFREEENFRIFSEQAYRIRNNQLDSTQVENFKEFTTTLNKTFPSRTLYPLQLLSSYHIAFSQNACNFSVPGSGKTSIVYGAYSYLSSLPSSDPKHVNKLIIIGPLSSFGPWESEYFECYGHEPSVKRLAGGVSKEEKKSHFYSSTPSEISLLSYNSTPLVIDDLVFFLNKFPTMVVLDEAHRIKNTTGGVQAQAVLGIARYCRSRIILTGTPAPNGYEDIFNLFKFIWPTKDIIPFHLFQLKEMSDNTNDNRIKTLVDSVSPYFIRIRKSDLHIPDPVNHPPIYVSMGPIQREIYEYIEKSYMDFFFSAQQSLSLRTQLAQARLIRLMQASTNPSLLKKPITDFFDESITDTYIDDSEIISKIIDYDQLETPPKFITALNLINNCVLNGEKIIVWCLFIQTITDFQRFLKINGVESEVLYGATPIDQDEQDIAIRTREKIIKEFHNPSSSFKVIIANPHAVSESISLHKACHNAIYMERSFNASHFIQSKDRIHRYGLNANDIINYYYLLSDNNIDFTIHQRLIEKEARMMQIIENEPIPLFSRLDANEDDDINSLINNYVKRFN